MLLLTPSQTATLKDWFIPDQPGPLVGLHVLQTGHGACFADRWPHPRTVLTASLEPIRLCQEVTPLTCLQRCEGLGQQAPSLLHLAGVRRGLGEQDQQICDRGCPVARTADRP
jgi:hypothetical protein